MENEGAFAAQSARAARFADGASILWPLPSTLRHSSPRKWSCRVSKAALVSVVPDGFKLAQPTKPVVKTTPSAVSEATLRVLPRSGMLWSTGGF